MSYLVRKISKAKWDKIKDITDCQQIDGDVISDLRTMSNTLSFWRINDESELDEAALALAASSKTSNIEKITIVWIPEDSFEFVRIERNSGDTIVNDLKETHRDLCDVTYGALGKIAMVMQNQINDLKCKIYTKKTVEQLLVNAYKSNRITKEWCDEKLLNAIENISKSKKEKIC